MPTTGTSPSVATGALDSERFFFVATVRERTRVPGRVARTAQPCAAAAPPDVPPPVAAATCATTTPGRFVMIASTPRSRHRSTSAGSSTVHTCTCAPARCARCDVARVLAHDLDRRPGDARAEGQRAVTEPQGHAVHEEHGRQARCERADPAHRQLREAHDADPRVVLAARARQSEALEQLDGALLDEAGVPRGVLGLDREADLALGVDHELEQPLEREHARARLVDDDRVGAERWPRGVDLPAAEVEPVEVVQGHDRDHAATVARAVDPPVVHAHQVPVGREPHVALERVGAVVDSLLVGGEGVLGSIGARPAMGHDSGHGAHRCTAHVTIPDGQGVRHEDSR